MAGVADNLAAMLEDRYHRGNYQDVTDRADAPLEDAVALMVRERLTGDAPPASSRKIVELWRDWIEERAGERPRRGSTGAIEDQRRFAGAVRDLLASLDMADELGSEAATRRTRTRTTPASEDDAEGAADEAESADAASPDDVEASAEESEAGEGEATEADADETRRRRRHVRRARHRRGAPRRRALLQPAAGDRLHGLHHPLRRDGARPRISATSPSSTACAPISTSSSPICRAPSAASPTACSAA